MKNSQTYVQNLFIKRERKASMFAASCLFLRRGWGVKEDVNSDRLSPRQVLVVCSRDLQQLSLVPGDLRENIVLKIASSELKPGAKLSFASGAAIRLTFYCEPCQRIAHLVDRIACLEQKRGILGVVTASGAIALDERVTIEPNFFTPLSEIPYERFLNYVKQIPMGKVVTYKQLLRCIGVDQSYFRAVPTYLKKAPANYPVHRVVDSQGKITPHILHQKELLKGEGVEVLAQVNCHKVALKEYAWNHGAIY